MNRSLSGALVALSLCFAAPATAADAPSLPRRQYVPANDYVRQNWAGDYIGLTGSYSWGRASSWDSTTGGFNYGTHGGLGGVSYLHYWQFGNVVFGPEVTWSWGSVSGKKIFDCGPGCVPVSHAKITSLGTVGANVGYALGDFLPYVGGGYARASTTIRSDLNLGGTTLLSMTSRQPADGWYAKAGLEYKLTDNITVGLAYQRTELTLSDFGDSTGFRSSQKATDNAIRADLRLRF